MSVQTLYTAATGMEALETKLDVIANNLANVNTVAFKKGRANFEDLFYRTEVNPGGEQQSTSPGIGTQVGLGTRVSGVQTSLTQGAFQQTDRTLDVAIEGRGFFRVSGANGDVYYTRAGNLNINSQGSLVIGSANLGRQIEPQITIDPTATDIRIDANGQIFALLPGQTEAQNIGTLTLTQFPNPEGLKKIGDNLYSESDASGNANSDLTPGTQGVGLLRQHMLEASNVEPVHELIDLIQTQRNFELNSQAVQAGDEIMQLISNLRR